MPTTTVAKYLASALPRLGATHVFELVGGMITVLLDAMHAEPGISVVSMHHEQGAGFAAEGFSRITGAPAVALATSGPGATNLLTAVGSCYFDSVPVVFITGQVNRHELGLGRIGRQGGFQELDIVSMAGAVTKLAVRVTDAETFPAVLEEAFAVALSGRPGPVLIDLPMDVQQASISVDAFPSTLRAVQENALDHDRDLFLRKLKDALETSERPLLLIGGGLRSAGQVDELQGLLDNCLLPVVVSLLGLDALPGSHAGRVGLIGSYGNRWANAAVAEADLLVVLGSRLDIRQTGSDIAGFAGGRKIFHVDVDSTELNGRVAGCETLRDDLRSFVPVARSFAIGWKPATGQWMSRVAELQAAWPDTEENIPERGVNPNVAIRAVCESWPSVGAWVTDVGQHQMWAAQSVQLGSEQRFLTSGGMGSMGFGLPAAIGAALARPGVPVCLVAGDGGFQCNIQELQTLVRLNLPVRILVLDNQCHGMVRQFQASYFDRRYHSTVWGYSAPDFAAIATAYGVQNYRVSSESQLKDVLDQTGTSSAPLLLHIHVDSELNVYPKMAFGQPYGSMEPAVQPLVMEGT